MATYRLSNPGSLDLGNHQDPAYGANTARCNSQSAAMDASERANANPQTRSPHALQEDALAYHEALGGMDSSLLRAASQPGVEPARHGCIRHDSPGADDVQDYRDQQHTRRRVVPINLASRLGNRSNGVPLATIIEQGSYSTLESRKSFLDVGPFSSLRVVENIAPSGASSKVSPSSDGHVLQLITESAQQERLLGPAPPAYYKPFYKDIGSLSPGVKTTIPSLPFILDRPKNIQHQSREIGCDRNSKNVKGLVHEVLHHARAVSRTRLKSSSTHTPVTEYHDHQPKKSKDGSQGQAFASDTFRSYNNCLDKPPVELLAPLGPNQLSAQEHPRRDPKTLTTYSRPSARLDFPLCKDPQHLLSSHTEPVVTPQPSEPTTLTSKCQQPCSPHLVDPESQAGLQEACCSRVSEILTRNGNLVPNRSAFYGVSVSSNPNLSLTVIDRTKDDSQNASFCSTISTSYSGTVVGVDVDLQHDFPHSLCHSRSSTSVAPVWFTPRTSGREEQAPASGSPEAKQLQETELPCQSLTSAALTTLLPIAAASGIVRPNYETPRISFFSPSGRLIQPEDCSTPSKRRASDPSSSSVVTSRYSKNRTPAAYQIFPATSLPPSRPSLRPMTTPPTASVPLPPNLRHHHNYKRPEKSQINPETEGEYSLVAPGPAVKGCDGIVQSNTLAAYSQTHRSDEKTKTCPQYRRYGSAKSFRKNLRLEVRSRQARMITAITADCRTTGKGRPLRKQNTATRHASMPHKRKCACAATTSGRKHLHTRHARRKHSNGLLGPIAGHVLRVCFCQPYDGAGKPTHNVSAKSLCMGGYASDMHENPNKESLPIKLTERTVVDAVLPNARVVTGVNRKINTTSSARKCMPGRGSQGSLTTKPQTQCHTAR